jgi:hypothetical protein
MGDLGAIISCINCSKFLGLAIQSNMTWDGHINDLIKKLNAACYMIRNIKQIVSMEILRSVYFSYFHSVMTYGMMFWHNSLDADKSVQGTKESDKNNERMWV